jgi:hypothetical protein
MSWPGVMALQHRAGPLTCGQIHSLVRRPSRVARAWAGGVVSTPPASVIEEAR